MFCPNCGKDCGNARFCSNCGTQLQNAAQEKQNPIWSVGMACPHCGGTRIEGKCCAFCGAQLILDMPQEKSGGDREEDSYEIPYGVYKGVTSSITLFEKAMVVENRILFKKYTTRIPYNDLSSVAYVHQEQNTNDVKYLVFRWKENKNLPIPPWDDCCIDKTTVGVGSTDVKFFKIFYILKLLAPNATTFMINGQNVEIEFEEKWERDINLERFFEKHSPHIEPAVVALCEETDIKRKRAEELIKKYFFIRQKEIYEADPILAVRDLNRILTKSKRDAERAVEEQKRSNEEYFLHEVLWD